MTNKIINVAFSFVTADVAVAEEFDVRLVIGGIILAVTIIVIIGIGCYRK